MDIVTPWTMIPCSAQERQALRRREVRVSLQQRAHGAQMTIDDEILPELERLHYEHELAQRLMAKAQSEAEREDWEIELSVLHDLAVMRAGDLEEQQLLIARYEAMIAEIDAERAVEETG
jgi:hypothetical protein